VTESPHILTPDPTPEEAAAIVAAVERFLRDTAPASAPPDPALALSPWKRAALEEGVTRRPD